jgi:hypothetical protein
MLQVKLLDWQYVASFDLKQATQEQQQQLYVSMLLTSIEQLWLLEKTDRLFRDFSVGLC